jgi:hypothetical protein
MALETRSTEEKLDRIRRDIAEVRTRIAEYQKNHPGEPFPFAKAKGMWKGKVHFTDADIETARIKARDFPE